MKVLFSELKKYLPDLKADVKEVCDVFSMTGSMLDKFFEVTYKDESDYLLDLEARQNRADNFGVQGLARELSAYYNIPLVLPEVIKPEASGSSLDVEIKEVDAVKRVMVVKLENVKIAESPEWLKEYLTHNEINSINNFVDLTNYVMFETAHASHAFDADLMGKEKLVWEMNPGYKSLVTLNGQELELNEDTLVVSNGERPLSLTFIGGKDSEINANTKTVLLEMAIYDGGLVRRNSRSLRTITEAGTRVEKYLDPESLATAFYWLLNLLMEHTGATIASEIFESYLHKTPEIEIEVNLDKVSQIAGIEISHTESIVYLERLGFEIVARSGSTVKVKRPINRLDIEIEEDVFEEIIRLKGFYNIPIEKPTLHVVSYITPSHLDLIDELKKSLAANGFDEVRSWVLVDEKLNKEANYMDWDRILVTNTINEEAPILRQSVIVSLIGQYKEYKKNYIEDIKLFEEGKIFGKRQDYEEYYHLGMLMDTNKLEDLQMEVEKVLRSKGLDEIVYKKSAIIPEAAHPQTCFDIYVGDVNVGIIFISNKNLTDKEIALAEIDINTLDSLIKNTDSKSTKEVSQKIVALDSNIILEKGKDINEYVLEKLKGKKQTIWKWEVIDKYEEQENDKYTVRISYSDLSDTEAKIVHGEIFG